MEMKTKSSSSSSSGAGSEPRDQLAQAELVEREMETKQLRDGSGKLKAFISRSSSSKDGGGSEQPHSSRSSSDVKSSGDSNTPTCVADLEMKVEMLQQALKDRDGQQSGLLETLASEHDKNRDQIKGLGRELKAVRKAEQAAQKDLHAAEMAQAGHTARHASQMAAVTEEKDSFDKKHTSLVRSTEVQKTELVEARIAITKQEAQEKLQREHQKKQDQASADQIASLQSRLSAVQALQAKMSAGGTGNDSQFLTEKLLLREELTELLDAKEKDREEMKEMRLEMLGLKQARARSARDSDAPSPSSKGRGKDKQTRTGRGKGGKGQSKLPATLPIIDEEYDDDLPSVDDTWASECVSSDAGDDMQTIPDSTVEDDMIRGLQLELVNERKNKQTLTDDLASQKAEHAVQLALMEKELNAFNVVNESQAADSERLREKNATDTIESVRRLDVVQLMVRDMEEKMGRQTAHMHQQTASQMQAVRDNEMLQEKLNLATEALRIAGLRMEDSKQHQAQAVQNLQREVATLKLQLLAEKNSGRGRDDHEELSNEDDESRPELILQRMVEELEEERNMLASKLEATKVQFQIQLEELELQHAAKVDEMQKTFEGYMEHFQEQFQEQFSASVASSSSLHVLPSTSSGGEVGSQSQGEGSSLLSDGSAKDPDKPRQFRGIQRLVWSVLNLVPGVAMLSCAFDGLQIQRVSDRASQLLGMHLVGQPFLNLLRDSGLATSLQRTVFMNQCMADSPSADIPGFIGRKLGNFDLCGHHGTRTVNTMVSMAHLPGDAELGQERGLVVVLTERKPWEKQSASMTSSEIAPSDSASVANAPKPMNAETKGRLRASFFSRQSASSTLEQSSPRESCRSRLT